MRKTGFFWDEECFWHGGGTHVLTVPVGGLVQPTTPDGIPENPESKRRLKNLLEVSGLSRHLFLASAPRVGKKDLLRVHTEEYVERFSSLSKSDGGNLGYLAPFGPGGFEIACRSSGLTLKALEAVLTGDIENSYALARPPGHHCLADFPNGFCLLNNIAIAICSAKAKKLAKKFVVVDWDVHHGNGTETIFYADPNVLTISIHQERNYPLDSGFIEDRGSGKGTGFNLNIPLPPGSGHKAYTQAMARLIIPSIKNFSPDVIIVACGFDASGVDPLGRMLCGSETFRELTKQLMEVADSHCDGRLVMSHEGGYSELHVPFCAHAVIEEMSGSDIKVNDPLVKRINGQQPNKHFNDLVDELLKGFERTIFS